MIISIYDFRKMSRALSSWYIWKFKVRVCNREFRISVQNSPLRYGLWRGGGRQLTARIFYFSMLTRLGFLAKTIKPLKFHLHWEYPNMAGGYYTPYPYSTILASSLISPNFNNTNTSLAFRAQPLAILFASLSVMRCRRSRSSKFIVYLVYLRLLENIVKREIVREKDEGWKRCEPRNDSKGSKFVATARRGPYGRMAIHLYVLKQ